MLILNKYIRLVLIVIVFHQQGKSITCLRLTIETLEQGMKYVQS